MTITKFLVKADRTIAWLDGDTFKRGCIGFIILGGLYILWSVT